MKAPIKITLFAAAALACMILLSAQKNYNTAIFYAQHSDGSDAGIEEAMQAHGFNVEAHEEITTVQKVTALFTNP